VGDLGGCEAAGHWVSGVGKVGDGAVFHRGGSGAEPGFRGEKGRVGPGAVRLAEGAGVAPAVPEADSALSYSSQVRRRHSDIQGFCSAEFEPH
jgi:hypothetical protein